ncbi:hypothetical protein C8Q80DRAFT_1265336 [Daedaleopsis nitida]|nr:hypothetical protein C8Q80DRAFT_1265336 [Daedaleopsis nitida]
MLLQPQRTCVSVFALLLLPWLLFLSSVSLASAALVNITVDDYYRDPLTNNTWVVYVPSDVWTRGPCPEGCTGANPEPGRTYFDTWHGNVYNPGNSSLAPYAQFPFEGVGVYVYCVIQTSSSTDLSFFIDNLEVGSYTYRSSGTDGTDTYEYAVPVYVNTSLSPGKHHIEIRNGILGSVTQSLAVLDYIIYTRDTTTEPIPATFTNTLSPSQGGFPQPSVVSNSSGTTGHDIRGSAIAISVAGAIVLTVVIALGHRYWKRYRRSRRPPSQQYLRSVEGGANTATVTRFVGGSPASAASAAAARSSDVQPATGPSEAGPSESPRGPAADQTSPSHPGAGIEEVPR